MRFSASIERLNGSLTGVVVPPEAMEGLVRRGRRTPVRVRLNGYVFLGSVALLGGEYLLAVVGRTRAAAGVAVGDQVEVEVSSCDSPYDVAIPADLGEALDRYPMARRAFERLTDAERLRRVLEIEEAATESIRRRRIDQAVASLRDSAEPGSVRQERA